MLLHNKVCISREIIRKALDCHYNVLDANSCSLLSVGSYHINRLILPPKQDRAALQKLDTSKNIIYLKRYYTR